MLRFIWGLVGTLFVAVVIALGLQSTVLALMALVVLAAVVLVYQRLTAKPVVAATVVGTELHSILDRLNLLRMNPTLPDDFLLPTTDWTRYQDDLVPTPSYNQVAAAYREVKRVNYVWSWRKAGAKGGIAANMDDDGLEALEGAVTAAMESLRSVPARKLI